MHRYLLNIHRPRINAYEYELCKDGALCNNTEGSFNCTYKPGFTGDGNNCTGNDTYMAENVLRKEVAGYRKSRLDLAELNMLAMLSSGLLNWDERYV